MSTNPSAEETAPYGTGAAGNTPAKPVRKVRTHHLREMKQRGDKITMLTSYDMYSAQIFDEAGVDLLLVGDSASNNVLGNETSLPVTVDELLPLTRAVSRSVKRAMVVGDLPFGSYQASPEQGYLTAVRSMKEAGAHCVKLEGGAEMAPVIKKLVEGGIPVMAHIGLTPQSYHRMGGHRVQGRESGRGAGQHERLLDDAKAVQEAGAAAVVLEGIPRSLAAELTKSLQIPTIGIGAGPDCDGQVLVLHDVIGLSGATFKFTKSWGDARGEIVRAIEAYGQEVRTGTFPDDAHSFH